MRDESCKSIVLILALVLGLSAVAYGASTTNTIIVTPSNEAAMGWTHYVTIFNHLPTMYPAACGFSVAPVGTVDVPGYGHGAFYGLTGNTLTTDPNDPSYPKNDVVGQVYIGTNNYAGIKLTDITKLYYRAFAADYTTFNSTHFTRTPWELQLAVPDSGVSMLYPHSCLMYRGWDTLVPDPLHANKFLDSPYSGEFPYDDHCMTWKGQDCMTGGNGVWVDFQRMDSNSKYPYCADWSHLSTHYGTGATIMAGAGYWPDSWGIHDGSKHNPTNTCLTFAIGCPGDEPPAKDRGSVGMDFNDNLNLCAWLDYFVIGYNKNSDPLQYTEDWIYFRPDPTPGTVATNNKSAWDKNILDNPKGWKGNYFVLYGKVLSTNPAPNEKHFSLTDGSGNEVRVKITGNLDYGPIVGDFVRVKGVLHRYGFANMPPDIFVDGADFDILVPR